MMKICIRMTQKLCHGGSKFTKDDEIAYSSLNFKSLTK